MKKFRIVLLSCLIVIGLPLAALCQAMNLPDQQMAERAVSGIVVSSSNKTMVVKDDTSQYLLFVFDNNGVRPRGLAVGDRVLVRFTPGDEPNMRVANTVAVMSKAPAAITTAGRNTTAADDPSIPSDIKRLERQIKRQVRKYNVGFRAGVALDPELIFGGIHGKFGPIFNPDVYFRPNAEIAFGEVTTQITLSLEAVYRLPLNVRSGRWSAYVGAGPGFALSHRNFESAESGNRNIDFGEFDWHTGLNVLSGIEYRSGMFIEFKSSVYATPHMRLMIGYTF